MLGWHKHQREQAECKRLEFCEASYEKEGEEFKKNSERADRLHFS